MLSKKILPLILLFAITNYSNAQSLISNSIQLNANAFSTSPFLQMGTHSKLWDLPALNPAQSRPTGTKFNAAFAYTEMVPMKPSSNYTYKLANRAWPASAVIRFSLKKTMISFAYTRPFSEQLIFNDNASDSEKVIRNNFVNQYAIGAAHTWHTSDLDISFGAHALLGQFYYCLDENLKDNNKQFLSSSFKAGILLTNNSNTQLGIWFERKKHYDFKTYFMGSFVTENGYDDIITGIRLKAEIPHQLYVHLSTPLVKNLFATTTISSWNGNRDWDSALNGSILISYNDNKMCNYWGGFVFIEQNPSTYNNPSRVNYFLLGSSFSYKDYTLSLEIQDRRFEVIEGTETTFFKMGMGYSLKK